MTPPSDCFFDMTTSLNTRRGGGAIAGNNAIGKFAVDGTTQGAQAIWTDNGANSRATVSQSWAVPLGAGSHTVKLRATKLGAGGTHVANTPHTVMTVLVLDLV